MSVNYLQMQIALIGILLVNTLLGGRLALAADAVLSDADKASISAIEFSLADDNLEQFAGEVSRQSIADQVSKNLAEWQYPIKPLGSAFSHRLKATLGNISRQSSPAGFSFSSGNSDPRSIDFQKADVLPVTCEFSKADASQEGIANTMTFSGSQLKAERNQSKLLHTLTDHISTACYNLLGDLKVPVAKSEASDNSFKPSWMPEVRIEVKEVEEPVKAPLESTTKAPSEIKAEADENGKKPEISHKVDGEGRKQLIIHNQGTPLIIEFGHERR